MLQKIYGEQSKLVVAFLSGDYDRKLWPGLEFRKIQEIIFRQQYSKIMYIRIDDASIEGVLKTDGYIDAKEHSAREIAGFIFERIQAQRKSDLRDRGGNRYVQ